MGLLQVFLIPAQLVPIQQVQLQYELPTEQVQLLPPMVASLHIQVLIPLPLLLAFIPLCFLVPCLLLHALLPQVLILPHFPLHPFVIFQYQHYPP